MTGTFGLMVEFHTPDDIVAAAAKVHRAGYRAVDAYTPFPVEGLAEAIGFHRNALPKLVFLGGLVGCLGGFFMQWFASVVHYPLVVGGKPLNSWPAFVVPAFEMTILFASFAAVLGMLGLNGLPQPYHPVFNVPRFAMASRDRFFLCIEATDPKFDATETRRFLAELGDGEVHEVRP